MRCCWDGSIVFFSLLLPKLKLEVTLNWSVATLKQVQLKKPNKISKKKKK